MARFKRDLVCQIDVDGVLADFVQHFTRLAKSLGFDCTVCGTTNQREWDAMGGLSKPEINKTWEALKASTTWWMECPSLIGSETWQRIRSLGARATVYFVTSRVGREVHHQTSRWLQFQGAALNANVIVTDGAQHKGRVAFAIGADWSIEDKLNSAMDIGMSIRSSRRSRLIDRPYNQNGIEGSWSWRVKTVDEFLDLVEKSL